jgi:DnaK suppressor protein
MRAQAMYNPGLFSPRQEYKMPAKKAASKKRKKTTATRKKTVARKSSAKKKVAKKKAVSRKKSPSRKKVTKKKVTGKKVAKKKAAKKKVAKKKATKKAASKKKVTKKKVAKNAKKKTAKKVSKKKPALKKKAASKKRPAVKKKVPARKPAARKVATRRAKPKRDVLSGPIHGIAPYKPKRGEEYMSDEHTVHHMQDEAANFPDPNDRATQESEFGLELRTRDRERKLLRKIDSALARIDEGSYGWCDETGEEIGLKRLEARPVATLCLEAQERRELAERQFRDRDDRYR